MSVLPPQSTAAPRGRNSTDEPAPRRARSTVNSGETRLVFLLAQQTIQQWQFLTGGGEQGTSPVTGSDIERGRSQVSALVNRLQPLTRSRNLATRFEAEELLQMLTKTDLALRALRPVGGAAFDTSHQGAVDVRARLTSKLRGRRRPKDS
ncbi:MAG: hypothetical protein ABL879_12260 [Devosia sp.]